MRVDELPCGTLGERLRCKVDKYGPCGRAFTLHGRDGRVVPVRLVVRAWVWVGLADRDYGRREHNPLHARAILQCGVQDRRGALHGGDDELCVKVEL